MFGHLNKLHKNHYGRNQLLFDFKFCCCFTFLYCFILLNLPLLSHKHGDSFSALYCKTQIPYVHYSWLGRIQIYMFLIFSPPQKKIFFLFLCLSKTFHAGTCCMQHILHNFMLGVDNDPISFWKSNIASLVKISSHQILFLEIFFVNSL